MIPNCLRMSGWWCLTIGSGLGETGFMTSYFTLSRIPVSLSHKIGNFNVALGKISIISIMLVLKLLQFCALPAEGFL